MPADKTLKQSTIEKFARKPGDTGSPEVQIAVMQSRISQITEHLKVNPKDNHSLRGLMLLVGKRRRLEGYLKGKNITRYREVMKELGIREVKPR
ncbi:MAG: 30S ribosomal protein S15 [Rhabdochlamydiaceae bacterium]